MTRETIVVNREEYFKLYALAIKMETFISYRDDLRPAINNMAPSFLEDCEVLLKEYKQLTKEK